MMRSNDIGIAATNLYSTEIQTCVCQSIVLSACDDGTSRFILSFSVKSNSYGC
jgi:hypothetical protein